MFAPYQRNIRRLQLCVRSVLLKTLDLDMYHGWKPEILTVLSTSEYKTKQSQNKNKNKTKQNKTKTKHVNA